MLFSTLFYSTTVCALPVAKRNFPKRHGHGLIHSAKDLKEVDYICGFIDSTSDDGDCQPGDESSGEAAAAAEDGEPAERTDKPRHRRVVSFDAAKQLRAAQQQAAARGAAAAQPMARARTKTFLDLSGNEKEWLTLLHQRPDLEQESMMSSWMDKIISFSEEKGSALRRGPAARIMEQTRFTPCHPQHIESRVTPTLPDARFPLEATPSAPGCLLMTTHSVSPSNSIEDNLKGFQQTQQSRHSEPARVDQIMHNYQQREARVANDVSEFASALDNVDMTNFFD